MKTIIDYNIFKKSGIIIGTTDEFNPISIAIRSLDELVHNGLEKGIEAIASTKIPSHTLITNVVDDLLECEELTFPKIDRIEMSEITINKLGNHICFVAAKSCTENGSMTGVRA